jgi:hypothetical protein
MIQPRAAAVLRAVLASRVLAALLTATGHAAEIRENAAVQTMDRSGLLLELRLDGTLRDTSGGERTVSAHGPLAYVAGRQGQCAAFDGACWIDTGVPQQDLGQEFTVECWVNPAGQQSMHSDLFGNHVSDALGFVVQQDGASTNDVYAAYGAGGGTWVIGEPVALTPGRWQHVALVKTREDLRFYLNGVAAAVQSDPAPVKASPLTVRLGLGYSDPARCFRGLIADFRVWNRAFADFAHAGIEPGLAREVLALRLDAGPRPAAGPLAQSWTLATDDTRLTLGVAAGGALVLSELSCPAAGHSWIATPVEFGILPHAGAGGGSPALAWRLAAAESERRDDHTLTLRFACAEPALEAESRWQALPGPGPVRHTLTITNRSGQPLVIRGQPTFDLDLTGASVLWSFHSDGGTPDATGVYQHRLTDAAAGQRQTLRTSPNGEFIPYVVFDAEGKHGLYLGLEWSYCRIETIGLTAPGAPAVRVCAGLADRRVELAPGQTLVVPPGFIGAYSGALDAAGNRLRRWLFRHCIPAILRADSSYPKVQWNAFGATGKTPGSWDPVEAKYYPLIDDIVSLGFEEVMIDVGWWEGSEPGPDPADWPAGMRRAAEYAQGRGLRFGLYWTDNLDMANPETRAQRAARIRRLFAEHRADMWRSDNTRGVLIGSSHEATRGFYALLDELANDVPGFQWENCCSGGRVKDYGAMQRSVKIFNSDTYSALHVRQAFYDSSYAFHPAQIEGHLGSTDGRFRPRGVTGLRFAFRSTSLGAPEWFLDAPNGGNGSEPWTAEERQTVRACVDTYKTRIRPLVRSADLYHVLPRPDGHTWDGIQYWDPDASQGVVYLFKPAGEEATQAVRLHGLEAATAYRLTFADGSNPTVTKTGTELLGAGLSVTLPAGEVSELVFIEAAR